jgi:hypothetical protein
VRVFGLLGLQRDPAVFMGLQCDSLVVDESSVLTGVLVGQVERITRELEAAVLFRLDKVGIVSSCSPLLASCRWRLEVSATYGRSPR